MNLASSAAGRRLHFINGTSAATLGVMPLHRMARLRKLATLEGMKDAAAVQRGRRGSMRLHRYVVGRFALDGTRIVLVAVEHGPAYNILRPLRLTDNAFWHYRWRTRQAADQFAKRWSVKDCHVIDTLYLDVLPADRK